MRQRFTDLDLALRAIGAHAHASAVLGPAECIPMRPNGNDYVFTVHAYESGRVIGTLRQSNGTDGGLRFDAMTVRAPGIH